MRLCRFSVGDEVQLGIYDERFLVPLAAGAQAYADATHGELKLPESGDLLDYLPPDGAGFAAAAKLASWIARSEGKLPESARVAAADAQLLVPIPRPNKLFLLAGNYAKHIEEGGREKAR